MAPPIPRPPGALTFADLPLETQQQIVRHMSRKDLFVFQRLSPHCFSLANAEIYRDLDLTLTNSGFEDSIGANSHAADALQTILASEHDYGQHIKHFRLGVFDDNVDILGHPGRSDPLLMTRLLWDSKSDSSKFLNTALLLMARKASIMETFQWDAPIELSGAVYQALHRISSLRYLRVRLDVTPSPKMVIRQGLSSNHQPTAGLPHTQGLTNPSQFNPPSLPGIGSTSVGSYPGQTGTKMSNIKRKKAGGNGNYNYWANPRVFSGFKHLSTLVLMGMSNLDCLTEIAECIKASSATLKSLTLTLSTDLARKARKPAPVNPELDDPSDTELDDEELMNDPLNGSASTTQQPPPANEADIRKEKLAQEGILARVFDLQGVAVEGKKIDKTLSSSGVQIFPEQDSEVIARKVNTLMKSLMDAPIISDADTPANATRLDHFKMIREVADLYITSQNVQKKIHKDLNKLPINSAAKKPGSSSKPLNPLASDFKQSGLTFPPPGFNSDWDADFSAQANPIPLTFDLPKGSSLFNGSSKPYVPSNAWALNNNPTYSMNTASTAATEHDMGSNSKPKPSMNSTTNAQHHHQQIKLAQIKASQQQLQAYMSPYSAGSYPNMQLPPHNSLPQYPSNANIDSPGLSGASASYLPYPAATSNGPPLNGAPIFGNVNAIPSLTPNGTSTVSKKSKVKPQKAKHPVPPKVAVVPESDEELDSPEKGSQPFFAATPLSEPPEDVADIDMEHPDVDTQELGEDQEILPEAEEIDLPTPRKRAKFEKADVIPSIGVDNDSSAAAQAESATGAEAISPDDAMQAYIRTAHGLQLDSLSLEWVPLRASIVARALDLSVLKKLTLLEVGPQDAFWTLLVRLQSATPEISFKSIHTDNVSFPFVRFLATFEGLEELFMHERTIKPAEDPGVGPQITITMIRKLALQKHAGTLKRLMIRNERSDSWDVDTKTLQFLAVRATKLRELGVSLHMKTYHALMQYFGAFKNLYALHLIALRSTDRNITLQNESLSFAVDSLSHCPDMKIKYIAIVNSMVALESKPEHRKSRMTAALDKRKDKKGKGKAPEDSFSSLLEQFEDSASDEVEEAVTDFMAGETKLKVPRQFADADDVKIFSKQVRMGKL